VDTEIRPADVPVFILAGGRGERLAGLTGVPKPLLAVAGRPFLLYLLASLKVQGFRRVTLLTGHRAEAFESWLREARTAGEAQGILRDLDVVLLPEAQPLGTAGALRRIDPGTAGSVLLLNGDSFCAVDYRALLRLQRARAGALCLAATRIADATDYGHLELQADGRILGFFEKGTTGEAWVNAGVYALPRRFLEQALPEGAASLEHEVLPRWVAREACFALRAEGYFCDIGTPARLVRAQAEFPAAAVLQAALPPAAPRA
jgi:NDP-sugar pyrophosphorylase family protein